MARLAGLAVVLSLAVTLAARASDGGSAAWLRWSSKPGAEACIGPDRFASKIERSLGRSPAAWADEVHVTVGARIERIGGATPGGPQRWWGEIRVYGADGVVRGSRSLSSDDASCEPLADALALATVLVLSGEAGEPSPLRAPGATGTREAERTFEATSQATTPPPAPERPLVKPAGEAAGPRLATRESARVEARPRPASSRAWRAGVDGALAFGIGLLPEASLGARASVFFQLGGGTRIYVGGSAWSQQTSAAGSGLTATMTLASLGLGICPLHGGWNEGGHAWTWQACARGDVGRLRAVGLGFTVSSSQDRLAADAAAAVEVQRRVVGPVYAGLAAELVVPLIRDRIAYSGPSGEVVPIFRPAPVAGIGALHLGYVF